MLDLPHFRSAQEAADWARDTLGIPMVNYADALLQTATIVNEALALVRQDGWRMPRAVFITEETYGGERHNIARLDPQHGGRLEMNPYHADWHGARADIQRRARQYGDSRWWNTGDVRHPIVHDLGHQAHWDAKPDTWNAT